MLSDSDVEVDDLHTVTLNEHYSKAVSYKKEREEFTNESDMSAEDSEDSESSEDSDGVELTPAIDVAILRTLARIRTKDRAIYDGDRQVFEEEENRTKDRTPFVKKRKEKSKPLTIRQAALYAALEDGHTSSRSPSPQPLTHAEQQRHLLSETRAAFHGALESLNEGNYGDGDDLLIPRSSTHDEIELEEEEYKAFLEREVGRDLRELVTVDAPETTREGTCEDDVDGERKKRKKIKKERNKEKKSKEQEDHDFLMNYIFDCGWIDRKKQRVPTYNEVVGSSRLIKPRKSTNDGVGGEESGVDGDLKLGETLAVSDEDSFDDLADAFEISYNFRFEEPGGAAISSHPRHVSSARRESTTRKEARKRRKERKEDEQRELLTERREEIRREREEIERRVAQELAEENGKKADATRDKKGKDSVGVTPLKNTDLRRKLEQIRTEGGLKGVSEEVLVQLDLDAPWDPEQHDAQMTALYGADNGLEDDVDMGKPVWNDDIDSDDLAPPTSKEEPEKRKKKNRKQKGDSGGEDGVDVDAMDADVDEEGWDSTYNEEWNGTEEMRKKKVDQYMEEVVNRLGFNDITAHMPTRFHYMQTTLEDYGLTPAEILLATDTELNSYIGLKKIAPYRKAGKGKSWDPKRNERLKEFRQQLWARVGDGGEGAWSTGAALGGRRGVGGADGDEKKKRLGKKERAKIKVATVEKDEKVDGHGAIQTPERRAQDAILSSNKRKYESPPADGQGDIAPAAGGTRGEDANCQDGGPKRKHRRRQHKRGSGAVDIAS